MRSKGMLLLFLLVVFGLGASGSVNTIGPWYESLSKPAWTPPKWLFGPVWSFLYLTIALTGWLAWKQVGFRHHAFVLFALQLALNAAWSWTFFGAHRIGLALIDIVALWIAILGTIFTLGRIKPAFGWLLLPYVLWVSLATALNFSIWQLNR